MGTQTDPSNQEIGVQTESNYQDHATTQVTEVPNIVIHNTFTPLESLEEEEEGIKGVPPVVTPKPKVRPPQKHQRKEPPPLLPQVTLSPLNETGHNGFYIPGQIQGKPVRFLIDTGCTTTVLSRAVFKQLSNYHQGQLHEQAGSAQTAGGQPVATYGYIHLRGRLRHQLLEHDFLIADITEEAILGMDFLQTTKAVINFRTAELIIGPHKLACVNKQGVALMARLYTPRLTQIPAKSELIIPARLQKPLATELVTTSALPGHTPFLTGSSIGWIKNQTTYIRVLNPQDEPIQLPTGKLLGIASSTAETEITSLHEDSTSNIRRFVSNAPFSIPPHLQDLWDKAVQTCHNPTARQKLGHLLCSFADVFSKDDQDVGRTREVTHSIPTIPGSRPIKQRARRLGPEKEKEVERQVNELAQQQIIEPGSGAWSAPVVLVKKKDGSWRFCVDYRKLNEVTIKDAYPLPRIDESLDALSGSKYFSTLDLTSGYWQVELDEEARDKAAFVTRNGLWRWKVLPFGLTSAPSTFERLMEKVLRGLHWKTVLIYLDDIVIFSQTIEQHLERLEEVLARLKQAGLKLKPRKCELFCSSVKYLGHVVSANGVSTDPEKVSAIRTWTPPTNLTELRSFLGATGYYRRFVPQYANIARPLTKLLGKGISFTWSPEAAQAFDTLRQGLMEAPILGYPDPQLPYILDTDASNHAMGAVLSQVQTGVERPIAYYSKTFSTEERNYCVTRRELLAVVKAMAHFRPYLYGQQFTLRTDHESLRWMTNIKEPRGQVARWLEAIQEFTFETLHRRGTSHGNADALSRRPCGPDCKHCSRQDEGSAELTTAGAPPFPLIVSTPVVARVQGDLTVVHRQQSEEPVATVYRAVRSRETPEMDTTQEAGTELRRWLQNQEHLSLREDGVLQIRLNRNQRQTTATVAPPSLRTALTLEVHNSNHMGEWRTYQRLLLNWYWPGMQADVRRTVRNCTICQQQKNARHPENHNRRRLYTGRPWQRLAIDFTGPLDETPRGNKWILVVTDHFTRWCDAYPLPEATAAATAKILDERVFSQFGVPENIHSDQGRQFQSRLFSELCQIWGCEQTQTTPYRPQANGLCERLNRTLGDALRTMLAEKHSPCTDWDLLLPQLMRNIRSTPHTTTGETANFLMLGREVRLPADLLHEITNQESQPAEKYAQQLQNRLQAAHQLLRSKQIQARVEDSEEPPLFKIGDLVWLKSHQRKRGMAQARKLQPKFIGPYKVIEVLSYNTYRLSRDGKETIEHEGRIKLHISNPGSSQTSRLPSTSKPTPVPCLPAPTNPAPQREFFLPELPDPYASHQLEIESLPNQTPQHFPEERYVDHHAPLAIGPPIEDVIADSPAPSLSEEITAPLQRAEETENQYDQDFPVLSASTNRRNPPRNRRLPQRLRDYDVNIQQLLPTTSSTLRSWLRPTTST